MTGIIFDIRHFTIHDGPGIRTTVFFKGCPLRCWWCHNPESQKADIEQVSLERRLDEKLFVSTTAVGSRKSIEEVISEIEKDVVFYQESGGGVTFSGGEPLMQSEFLAELIQECRKKDIHTAIDTCGYADPAAIRRVMDLVDLWLFDLKILEDIKHIEYTGLSNDLSLSNLKTLVREGKQIIIRFPVVPGITDTPANVMATNRLMKLLGLKRIDLLPYHSIAKDKYWRLGRQFQMTDIEEPGIQRMEQLKQFFSESGMEVG